MSNEEINKLIEKNLEEKKNYLDSLPENEREELLNDSDFWDAHDCEECADEYGYCQICGAVVYGSLAYFDLYDGE